MNTRPTTTSTGPTVTGRRCPAETSTRTRRSPPAPRPKTRSRRWPDQRISPSRMTWTRFSAPTVPPPPRKTRKTTCRRCSRAGERSTRRLLRGSLPRPRGSPLEQKRHRGRTDAHADVGRAESHAASSAPLIPSIRTPGGEAYDTWTGRTTSSSGAEAAERRQAVSGCRYSVAILAHWCRIYSYLDSRAPLTALDTTRAPSRELWRTTPPVGPTPIHSTP
jgi:hypothetical protein